MLDYELQSFPANFPFSKIPIPFCISSLVGRRDNESEGKLTLRAKKGKPDLGKWETDTGKLASTILYPRIN